MSWYFIAALDALAAGLFFASGDEMMGGLSIGLTLGFLALGYIEGES